MLDAQRHSHRLDSHRVKEKSTTSTVNGAESTDVRTVNEVNEYVTRQIDAEPQVTLDTDTNGNLVDDGKQVYAYDAENRLISVTRRSDSQLLQTYKYDPLGRRVKTLEPAGAGAETDTTHVYSSGPACLAEYDSLAAEGDERLRWFVHGPGFPDPLVMVDESALGDKAAGVEEVLYYLKDMLGSVVALTDSNGLVVERYEYDPYGRTEVLTVTYMHDANLDGKIDASDEAHLNACLATEEMQRHPMCVFVHDTDGDGIVDLDDLSVFQGFDYTSNGPRPPAEWERAPTSLYDANNDKHVEMFDFYGFQVCFASTNSLCHFVFDGNNDSQVTLADYTTFLASYQRTAPTRTATSGASRFGNPFMWTGQRYDAAVGLYHFLFRSYSPRFGRWLQRDPLGYVDTMSLYQNTMSNPISWSDPFGLVPTNQERMRKYWQDVYDVFVKMRNARDQIRKGIDLVKKKMRELGKKVGSRQITPDAFYRDISALHAQLLELYKQLESIEEALEAYFPTAMFAYWMLEVGLNIAAVRDATPGIRNFDAIMEMSRALDALPSGLPAVETVSDLLEVLYDFWKASRGPSKRVCEKAVSCR